MQKLPAIRGLVFCLTALAAFGATRAEIIHLTDGTQVAGKIRKSDSGWVVTKTDGTIVNIDSDKVVSIEVGPADNSASVGMDRLKSLRSVCQHLDNLSDIIGRYQKFISLTTDPQTLAAANEDLAQWQSKQDQGLIKLGDAWITPAQRQQRRIDAQSQALAARDLVAQYKYPQAADLLTQALQGDPQSATALYVQGVMQYKQGQIDLARKSFELAAKFNPHHAPTLNNLAVIAWKQHKSLVAIDDYRQAMISAPLARGVLDNVAEALNAMPDQYSNAPVLHQAKQMFTEQNARLATQLAQRGLYRWGATWVTSQQLAELKAEEAKIQARIDEIQRQIDSLQAQAGQLDTQISQNQRDLDRMIAQNTYIDPNSGNQVQMPLPTVYYSLKADTEKLKTQKTGMINQAKDLVQQQKKVAQDLPTPKFTGEQRLIDVQAAPVRASDAMNQSDATTQSDASTQPSDADRGTSDSLPTFETSKDALLPRAH